MESQFADRTLAEYQLDISEALGYLQVLQENLSIGLALLDRELRFRWINRCLAAMNSLPIEAHLGKRLDELIGEPGKAAVLALQRVIDTGEPLINFEVSGPTIADLNVIGYWEASYYPIRNNQGEVTGISIVVQDITERKQTEQTLARRARQQAAIATLGQKALVGQALTDLFSEAAMLVSQMLDVEYVRVLEYRPEEDDLLLRAGVGWKPGMVGVATIDAGADSQAGYALRSSNPVIVNDLRKETRFTGAPLLQDHGVISGMSIPIPGRGQPFGVLGAHTQRKRTFTDDDVTFLQAIATLLANAVHRMRVESDLARRRFETETILQQLPAGVVIFNAPAEPIDDSDPTVLQRLVRATYGAEKFGRLQGSKAVKHDGAPYAPSEIPIVRSLLTGEDILNVELDMVTPDGARATLLVNSTPIRDEDGTITGAIATFWDVSNGKLIAKNLEESELLFRMTFDQAAVGMSHVDLSGRWLRVNQKLCDIVGYTREEMLGAAFQSITYKDDIEADVENKMRLVSGEISMYAMEKRYIRPDNSLVWVNLTVSLVRGEHGEPKYFISVIEDISERKHAEAALRESEERFRSMADTAPVMIWTAGTNALFDYVNKPWLEFTGRSAEAENGNGWLEGIHPDDLKYFLDTFLNSFRNREPFRLEYRLRHADGAYRWLLNSAIPRVASDGSFAGYIGSCIDITDRRTLERVRHETIAMVGHELKTPVSTIKGVASGLNQTDITWEPAMQRELLGVLETEADRLDAMVTDMLDMIRLELRGLRLEPEPCSLADILEGRRRQLETLAKDHELKLDVPDDLPLVLADYEQIGRVVANLVSNATKYSPEGTSIQVVAQPDPRSMEVLVSVSDQGIGIAPEDVEKIFTTFYRVSQRQRQVRGSGVGLTLVKGIVEGHGGKIWVESQPGIGSTFYVTLPMVPATTDRQ